jgi:GntR family transcriptional regulator
MHHPKSSIAKSSRGGVTRYLLLYTRLAQDLTDGLFEQDKPLPSEPQLVARFQVSRTTVRRALARLEKEGRIVRRRGSGTFGLRRATKSAPRCPCCGQPILSKAAQRTLKR